MNVCIFEDSGFSELLPLTYTRPVFELKCGIFSLREKIEQRFPDARMSLICRKELQDVLAEDKNIRHDINSLNDEDTLFVNGRAILDDVALAAFDPGVERLYVNEEEIIAAMIMKGSVDLVGSTIGTGFSLEPVKKLERKKITAKTLKYFWDFVAINDIEIAKDFERMGRPGEIHGTIYPRVTLIEQQSIFVGHDTTIKSGTVLDAEEGPIYIGRETTILPNVTIIGPVFIDDNCKINAGAKIYPGTSIGFGSKVGGEVAETIIQSLSNKQHDGFLGHSYLGQWVNLGADTNNSDLKNNYSDVHVEINGKKINSQTQFVGSAIGDHSKTAINTMLNTGTVIGAFSNVFGGGFPPKYIPSFTWGGAGGLSEHDFEKAMITANRVMNRRQRELTPALESCYRSIFKLTGPERIAAGI